MAFSLKVNYITILILLTNGIVLSQKKSAKGEGNKKAALKKGDDNATNECFCNGLPGANGVQGIQGIQGVQGVQGPVGPTGLAGLPGRKPIKGEKGDRGARGRKGDPAQIDSSVMVKYFPHIAFSVALDQEMEPVENEYRPVKYNIIISNVGQCYDAESGVFTSTENGTFIIGFTGVSAHGYNVLLHLVRNGQRLLSAFDNSGCGCCGEDVDLKEKECAGSAGNVAIVPIAEGDRLWVQLPNKYGLHNAPYHNYAAFYGYLLFIS